MAAACPMSSVESSLEKPTRPSRALRGKVALHVASRLGLPNAAVSGINLPSLVQNLSRFSLQAGYYSY